MSWESVLVGIEKKSGLKRDQISSMSIDELRFFFNNKYKSTLTFFSEFPYIGRGNVLRENITTRDKINKEIDAILSSHSK